MRYQQSARISVGIMKIAVFLVVFAVAYARPLDPMSLKALSQDIIDYTNSLNTTWKAAKSLRFEGVSEDYLRGLCGVLPGGPTLPVKEITPLEDIPDEFDARTQWPDCPSISDIRDQGSCGSCWVRKKQVFVCLHTYIINFVISTGTRRS